MKKILLSLVVAAAALFATSCANELEEGIQGNGNGVTFEISAPELATRAYGEGTQATHLMYAVYDETAGGEVVRGVSNIEIGTEAEFTADANGVHKFTTSVQIDLLDGNLYSVLFWAVNENYNDDATRAFTINWDEKAMEMKRTIAGNNDAFDAFYGYVPTFKVEGAVTKSVTLTRPFAQLNFGSTDFGAADSLNFVPNKSSVIVKNAPTKLNCVNGEVSDEANIITYSEADVPGGNLNGLTAKYLAMNYVLVNGKRVFDTTLSVTGSGKTITNDYASVPMQRNYRTNVYGALLTNKSDFGVEIKPGFSTPDENMEIVKYQAGTAQDLQNAIEAINNATDNEGKTNVIELTGDIDLNDLFGSLNVATRAQAGDPTLTIAKGRELLLDLKGNTLSSKSYQTGKNYNMFDVHGTLTVINGTITTEHKGDNMAWGNCTEIFHLDGNAVIEIENVTLENKGGSAMAYAIDFTNVANATVKVNNSTLKSTYIPVRVFNNAQNGIHNLTIENTTIVGKYGVWVQYYKGDREIVEGTLNLNVFNNGNTYDVTNIAVMYGFNEYYNFNADGSFANEAAFNDMLSKGNVVLNSDIEIAQIDLSKVNNNVVIDANNHNITTTASYGVKITPGKNVTIKNANIVMTKNGDYINYAAGIKIENGDYTGNTVQLENCKVTMANTDWAYGVNMPASVKNLTLNIDNCELDGAVAVQCWGDGNNITINDSKLICTYTTNAQYTSYCVVLQDDGSYAAENNTLTIDGCEFSYDGVDEFNSDIYSVVDRGSKNNTVTVTNSTYKDVAAYGYNDVVYTVETADELVAALERGKNVVLTNDVAVASNQTGSNGYGKTGISQLKGGTIDGNGYDISVNAWGTWDSAINTTGGTIKNINVTGGMRGIFVNHNSTNCSKVILENVTIDGTVYTISCDQGTNNGLEATNSTFNGWTSYAATLGKAKFTDCNFGEGQGYAFCRPYAPTEFVGCDFAAGYTMDACAAVTFENCTIGGVALTAENLATLVTSNIANATVK